jgi:hypothetical protein
MVVKIKSNKRHGSSKLWDFTPEWKASAKTVSSLLVGVC